jgi:MFS transporter, NNP family, nitrate/nitrite transporter
LGGLFADKLGGARVTFCNFIAMGIATLGVMHFVDIREFAGFFAMFLILFVLTGVGNGSTFRMIPSIFREEKLRQAASGARNPDRAAALRAAGIESAAVLGFTSAIGACGGYLIPRGFGASIAATGGPHLALEIFLTFYVTCVVLTWWHYPRRGVFAQGEHRLAASRV